MNFFKLYIGDYQRDTAHLSVVEHGAFMLMLQHYYATERPLPTGKALHRMLRAQDKVERDAIDSIAAQFWRTTDAGLVNDRADEEIRKASKQCEANRAVAMAREDARRSARKEHESCNESSHEMSTTRTQNQTPEPDTIANSVSKKPRLGRGTRLPPDWDPGAEGLAFAAQLGLVNGRANTELAKFRDYWAAATGQTASKADWQATWRNWVRKAVESAPRGMQATQPTPPAPPNPADEWLAEQAERAREVEAQRLARMARKAAGVSP